MQLLVFYVFLVIKNASRQLRPKPDLSRFTNKCLAKDGLVFRQNLVVVTLSKEAFRIAPGCNCFTIGKAARRVPT